MLKKIFFVLYILLICEIAVQMVAAAGLIPGGFSKSTHVPYGRVYWSKEGFANSIMNRYGWYYTEFTEKPSGSHRLALIGDSYIEALQVDKAQHMGVLLEESLKASGRDVDVIALGDSGAGVAQYLEMMRYAHKHHRPDEYILFIYMGNDYQNAVPALEGKKPDKYVYYQLDDNNETGVSLMPESLQAQGRMHEHFERNHEPLYRTLGEIVRSHIFFPQLVRDALRLVRQKLGLYDDGRVVYQGQGIAQEFRQLGLDASVFQVPLSDEAKKAIRVNHLLLSMCRDFAKSVGAEFKVVTIPVFPTEYYLQEAGAASFSLGNYDFSHPEQLLIDYAAQNDITLLPIIEYMEQGKESLDTVRSLYLLEGRGHLSATGHAYFARALQDRFYGQ